MLSSMTAYDGAEVIMYSTGWYCHVRQISALKGVTGIPLTALPVICLSNSNTPFNNKEKTKANSIATSIAFISDNF